MHTPDCLLSKKYRPSTLANFTPKDCVVGKNIKECKIKLWYLQNRTFIFTLLGRLGFSPWGFLFIRLSIIQRLTFENGKNRVGLCSVVKEITADRPCNVHLGEPPDVRPGRTKSLASFDQHSGESQVWSQRLRFYKKIIDHKGGSLAQKAAVTASDCSLMHRGKSHVNQLRKTKRRDFSAPG